jgi:hypothetical protein
MTGTILRVAELLRLVIEIWGLRLALRERARMQSVTTHHSAHQCHIIASTNVSIICGLFQN